MHVNNLGRATSGPNKRLHEQGAPPLRSFSVPSAAGLLIMRFREKWSALRIGFPLESVGEVGIAPAQGLPQALQQIGGPEEWAPKFVLPHMHAFVSAQPLHGGSVDREDDMPQSEGDEAMAVGQALHPATQLASRAFQGVAAASQPSAQRTGG